MEKIQTAPEATKTKWLVASAAVIMVVVVYIWLAYFNSLLASGIPAQVPPGANGVQAAPQGNDSAGAASANSTSFLDAMKNAAANMYHVFSDKLHALGGILQAPREYIIKPPQ